jgi:hypothetical protein
MTAAEEATVGPRNASVARPDLSADRVAAAASLGELVRGLGEILGKKLTAYLAGARDPDAIDRWTDVDAPAAAKKRLRRAYVVALTLRSRDASPVVQAWFTGLNPELDDRSPIRLLAEGGEAEARAVLGAARQFRAIA